MIDWSKYQWFATAAFGLEGVIANELKRMGISSARGENGGARFSGTPVQAFQANLQLRSADRVLLILKETTVDSFESLFQAIKSIPWEKFLPRDAVFPVNGKCARSRLMSVRDCQAITKKAIVERLKEKYRIDWFPETGVTYSIDISIHSDMLRVTLDTTGEALNRRGYRTWNGEAPLRETLAAALVDLSPWRPGMPLHDPCCGTGTLLIEAALKAAHCPPGINRTFACEAWHFMPKAEMNALRQEGLAQFNPEAISNITGSDIDSEALQLCKRHIVQAKLSNRILVQEKALEDLTIPYDRPGVFIVNPPYGERLSDKKQCEALYRSMGQLQARHPGWSLCAIVNHPGFERCYGRRADKKRRLYNGRLECEFMIFLPR